MKRIYNSIEELLSVCCNSQLKSGVSSVLRNNKYVRWELLSCFEEEGVSRADFVSRDDNLGLVIRLFYKFNEMGQFGHITVEAATTSAAKVF